MSLPPIVVRECERCKQVKETRCYSRVKERDKVVSLGYPTNRPIHRRMPGTILVETGEFLCTDCVPLRIQEMDRAIVQFKEILNKGYK